MNNEELNKAAALMCDFEWVDRLHVKDKSGTYVIDGNYWNPADDMNQIMYYIFPRLLARNVDIRLFLDLGDHVIQMTAMQEVEQDDGDRWNEDTQIGHERKHSLKEMKPAILKACLDAWEVVK